MKLLKEGCLMPSQLSKLKKEFEAIRENFFYDMNGTILVHRQDLSVILGVSTQSIKNYENKGLTRWGKSPNRVPMYNLINAIDWYRANIDTKHRATESNVEEESKDVQMWIEEFKKWENVPLKYLPKDEIERRREIEKYEQDSTKTKFSKGELVEADKQDLAMAEQAIIHISHLKSYKKLFPTLIPGDASVIKSIVDKEFSRGVAELNKLVNPIDERLEDDNDTLYDVVETLLSLLAKGESPKVLKAKLNEP